MRRLLFVTALVISLVASAAATANRPAQVAFQGLNGTIAFGRSLDVGAPTAQFIPVGSMVATRASATATTLSSGRVLVVGGYTADQRAELYDPESRTFSLTAGLMSIARSGHTATLLPNGTVLIAGGQSTATATASAELYDPSSGTFSTTGSMTVPRGLHTATLLPNGKVLIAGGGSSTSQIQGSRVPNSTTRARGRSRRRGAWRQRGSTRRPHFWETAKSSLTADTTPCSKH
jgi:Galactose oxidase, central domain